MKRIEIVFLVVVLGLGVAFSALSLSYAVKAISWASREAAPRPGAAGLPRDVDMARLRRLMRQGFLSDHEALFYRQKPDLTEDAGGPPRSQPSGGQAAGDR